MNDITHWIGGTAWTGETACWGDVYDPATGRVAARVAFADRDTVSAAVESAGQAVRDWRHASLAARSRVLFAFREQVERRKKDIAGLLTAEHGKVASDALGEVNRGLEVVEFACGIPQLLKGEFSENVSTEVDSYSIRQPLGVVAGITPFNFPAMVPMWMFPIAIACGNAFILKPSEKDPSASLLLARLWEEAGLPAGVFNVVPGFGGTAGKALASHMDVDAIAFTGSTATGKLVAQFAAQSNLKRVSLECGGKSPNIVMADYPDLKRAARAAAGAIFFNQGEMCSAGSRLLVQESIRDALLEEIVAIARAMAPGDPLDPATRLGALVDEPQTLRVMEYIDAGRGEGTSAP